MRIFLSLGMRDRDEKDVLHDIKEATCYIKHMHPGCEVINTYQQEGISEDAGPTYYLGKSIQIIGTCDQVWFINNWKDYRGCRVEYEICSLYGIPRHILDFRSMRVRIREALDTPKNPSAYDLFQVFEQTINNAKNTIKDIENLVSEYKDLYPDAHLLLDASENAISIGLKTIDQLIHVIEIESEN